RFANTFPGRGVDPALTTVGQPVRDLGVRAAARLLERIEGSTEPARAETLPTELVIRRSRRCPAPPAARAPPRGRGRRGGAAPPPPPPPPPRGAGGGNPPPGSPRSPA